jgi:SatD family (SatD)
MKRIILMADVVKSHLHDQRELISEFKEIVHEANSIYKSSLLSPLTITLGDEFQGILKNASTALELIIHLEESLIHRKTKFNLRYVLHEGEIETEINDKIAFEMLGEGLSEARRMMETLKEDKRRFHIVIENSNHSELLNCAFRIFESITERWREKKDEEIISNFLKYKDYKKIADILERERSLIWKRQKSLQLESYYSIKSIIELSFKLSS